MRISITELDTFQQCQQRHYYRHHQNLVLADTGEEPEYRVVGQIVARAIELGAMLNAGEKDLRELLDSEYPEELVDRAWRAIGVVPEWVWQIKNPMAEDKLEVDYRLEAECVVGPGCLVCRATIVGKPDLWYSKPDMGVVVVEFKSSADPISKGKQKLENYEKWGIQASRYAVLLRDSYDWMAGEPIYRQHVFVSTRGYLLEGKELLVHNLDEVREEMLMLAGRMAEEREPVHTFGPLCNWCEYSRICQGWVTGQDTKSIMEGEYVQRVRT